MMYIEIYPNKSGAGTIRITASDIKSYSEYHEICLTGLALPDSTITFTAEIKNPPQVQKGTDVTIWLERTTGGNKKVAHGFASEFERVSGNMYNVTCVGALSLLNGNFDGDYYTDLVGTAYQKTVADVLADITYGIDSRISISVTNSTLANTVVTGRITPCSTREALQSLLYMTRSVLMEETPANFKMVPVSTIQSKSVKNIPSTSIFRGATLEKKEDYVGLEMTIVNYHSPTTYDLDSSRVPTENTPSANGLIDHILYWKTSAPGPASGSFYADEMYYHTLWFYNLSSNPLVVSCHPSSQDSGTPGKKSVASGATTRIRRANTNSIEMSCTGGLKCNVYGFKMFRAENVISKKRPVTTAEAISADNVLSVNGGEILNAANYAPVFDYLYDYFVDNPRQKYNMTLVGLDYSVGDRVKFPTEFNETATGIIVSMNYSPGNKRIADAVIVCDSVIPNE